MRSVLLEENDLRLLTPEEAQDEGYAWNDADYPAEAAPQEEPPTQPTDEHPTEPTPPTEPAPTEPVTEEPTTEATEGT